MSRVPRDLKGLLKFCMQAGSDFNSEAELMDPERAKWLRQALESMTVDLVTEMKNKIVSIIKNMPNINSEDKKDAISSALDDLIDYTEDVNLADVFIKIGGMSLIKALLGLPSSDYRAQTGMLLSNVTQNHEEAQKLAIKEGILGISLRLLTEEMEPSNMGGLISGISSMVRGCEPTIESFVQCAGLDRIFKVLQDTSGSDSHEKYARFNGKASFFLYCLCQEFSEQQLKSLEGFHLSDRMAQLIVRIKESPEFLVKGLILLLTGRVSSLIDPPPEPTPGPLTLFKLPLSAQSRKMLLEWANSPMIQNESVLEPETRNRLLMLLK